MNDLSPHAFQPGIESWIRTINGASDANKLLVFRHAAGEIASYVGKGFNRTEAIDTLQEIATEQGLVDTHGQDEIQAVIAVALDNSLEQKAAEPPPPSGPEDYGLPPVANGEASATTVGDRRSELVEISTFKILSKRQFIEGFVPPDYLIDGMLQRGYVYAITAATGHGKTALALLIAGLVGRPEGDARLGPHAVDTGKVIYFAGENPDDLRMRVIGDDAVKKRDGANDNISFIPGVFSIAQMRAQIGAEAERVGGVNLVVVDTSAAYFLGNDELSNTQMGAHARTLRTLTSLPGHPTVIVLCHPIKHATEPAQLLPRGGGAFVAELDGNLTLWKKDDVLLELWHGKMRGAGFEPITFRVEKITTTALTDSKGRLIPTVRAVPVTQHEEETEAHCARSDEDELLVAMLESGRSVAQLATACGWTLQNGDPYKSKVHRVMQRLLRSGLVKSHRDTWQLTDPGKNAAKAANTISTEAHRWAAE